MSEPTLRQHMILANYNRDLGLLIARQMRRERPEPTFGKQMTVMLLEANRRMGEAEVTE